MENQSFLNKIFSSGKSKEEQISAIAKKIKFEASHTMFSVGYDGEKNEGDLGVAKDYYPEYDILRARSWQSYLDSDITHNIINKFKLWVVGNGLKLQAEPNQMVLKANGINIDPETFSQTVEAYWKLHTDSTDSTHNKKGNLHTVANEAFKHSEVGGDCLIHLRYNKKTGVSAQMIDGVNLQTPFDQDELKKIEGRGNIIQFGIEKDPMGEHVAYYIAKGFDGWQRIPSRSKGRLTTYMVVGSTYREDTERGIPLIAPILESLAKLERYKEATIGSAEQVAKIAYYIYHKEGTSDENPIPTAVTRGLGIKLDVDGIDTQYEENIAQTTNQTAINMPAGAELRALTNQNDLYFKEFYEALFNLVCASLGIPPEVASDKYDSNFSSARAALKSWEHTLNVRRKRFADQFYKPFYEFWLETSVLEGTIQVDDFLTNFSKNRMVRLAFFQARFKGVNIPHIDPLKEVAAERAKLGNDYVPLTTVEAATEAVNGGDSNSNFEQYRREQEQSKDLNEQPSPVQVSGDTNEEETEE